MMQDLDTKPYEERLRELGMFRLENTESRDDGTLQDRKEDRISSCSSQSVVQEIIKSSCNKPDSGVLVLSLENLLCIKKPMEAASSPLSVLAFMNLCRVSAKPQGSCKYNGEEAFSNQLDGGLISICRHFRDVNTAVMELLIMAYALKTSCAKNITGVIPYFPYSKQSKMRKRGSIVCKLLASMLAKAGLTHIITMDLHQKEIQGFFSFPVDNLRASPFLLQYIQEEIPDYRNAVIVAKSPDAAKRSQDIEGFIGHNQHLELGPDFNREPVELTENWGYMRTTPSPRQQPGNSVLHQLKYPDPHYLSQAPVQHSHCLTWIGGKREVELGIISVLMILQPTPPDDLPQQFHVDVE
ncbi:Phosphoribosyl pyrophosphate synthase-associated protein 1 [Varanus komodoensis]|nr:Phosphoribosyl pyrophosphate synthase-associated protein 1 [Varanus komodoensis]